MHFYSSTTLVTFLAISSAALLNAAPKSHHHPKHHDQTTQSRSEPTSQPTSLPTVEPTSTTPSTPQSTPSPNPDGSTTVAAGSSAWQPDFSKSKVSEIIGPIVKGAADRVDQMVAVGSNDEIIFNFGQGSRGSNGPGAVAVYSGPTAGGDFGQTATLTYKVKFQDGFQWNKGGKLHGLYGGNLQSSCSGGVSDGDCFSSRIMWRADGAGEAYIYLPNMSDQVKYYCANNAGQCTMGISVERGSFKFIAGQEHTIKMTIALNTPNVRDGSLVVNFDGQDVINRNDIMWAVQDGIKISALFFNSFFGGGDDTWASPQDQSITFSEMSITTN